MKKCWLLVLLLLNFCVNDEKMVRKKGEKTPLRTNADKQKEAQNASGWETAD